MPLPLAVALAVVAVLFLSVVLPWLLKLRRRPGEAPLHPGLPLLGSTLFFARDPSGFLGRLAARHGSEFTIDLGGRRTTFVVDPLDYPHVLRNSTELDFHEFSSAISRKAFGWAKNDEPVADFAALTEMTLRLLRGKVLDETTERYERLLLKNLDRIGPAGEQGLYALVDELLFSAGADTLFGEGFTDASVREAFWSHDKLFAVYASGVHVRWFRKQARMLAAVSERILEHRSGFGPLLEARSAQFDERGLRPLAQGRLQFAMLWAAVANTVPSGFWALAYLLKDPEATQRVTAEVRALVDETGDKTRLSAHLDRLPLVQSVVSEALRLSSASMSLRHVQSDFTLTLHDGRERKLRQGEFVALFPPLTHMDPEIFSAPEAFVAERFLGDPQARKFQKGGCPVRQALMPFGGGKSICPGRMLARNEIALLVAHMLLRYDLRLASEQLPELDRSRVGLGVLPPVRDVQVQVSAR